MISLSKLVKICLQDIGRDGGDLVHILWIVLITVVIAVVSIGLSLYFLKSKSLLEKASQPIEGNLSSQAGITSGTEAEKVIVIEVEFKGFKGTYTYGVVQSNIYKGQYVLVLTRDGIRCAKVVTDAKIVKQSQLTFPPFLLENIVCIADEVDLEYYS